MDLHGDTERFRLALEGNPAEVGAFRSLRAAYGQEGRWADLCRLYERRAEVVQEPVEATHCLLAAGDLWRERAGDLGRAIECYRRILAGEPKNRVALDALEEAYRACGRQRDLFELLLERARIETSPPRRGDVYLRMAELTHRELHRPAEAIRLYREALQSNPALRTRVRESVGGLADARPRDPAVLAALEALFRELDDGTVADGLLQRRAELAEDAQEKADLYCNLADRLQRAHAPLEAVLGAYRAAAQASPLQPGRIVDGLKELLAASPGCRPAMSILRRVYGDLHRWNEVLDLLEEEIELVRGVESAELMLEMGIIEEERLFRPDRAAAHYREAVQRAAELAPRARERLHGLLERSGGASSTIRRALGEVLAASGSWSELEVLLDQGRSLAETDRARHDFALAAARLRLERLGDPAGARDLLISVLQEDPEREEAVAGLDALLAEHPEDSRAMAVLSAHYRDHARWKELADLLERQLAGLSEPLAQAPLHYELGRLWEEQLGRPENAMAHYQAAFRLDPAERRAIAAGARIYRQMRRWPMVVRLLELELSLVQEPGERRALLLEEARIFRRHLRQPVEACTALLDIIEAGPDEEARREARSLLAVAEDRDQVLERLEREGQQDQYAQRAAQRMLLAALLFEEEPPDLELAQDILRRAYRLDAENPAIFQRLERTLWALGRWAELVELYLRAAARELDADREEELRLEAVRILVDRLRDIPRAIRTLRQALELNAANVRLRAELRDLLVAHQEWRELSELYRWAQANAPDLAEPALRREMLAEWAQLCLGPLADRQAAAEPYGLLLAMDCNHPEALDYFRKQLTETREWERLVHLLDRAWSEDPHNSRELLAESARLVEERLGDIEGAIERWSACLRRWPADAEARQALERLYSRAQRWEPLIDVLVAQATAVPDAGNRAELLRQAADVAREGAGDLDQAERLLAELLALAPNDTGALEMLGDVYEARGRWDALAGNLGRRAALAREMARRAELLRRRAALLSRHLGAQEQALQDLEQVLDLFPEDLAALELSREVLTRLGRADQLLQVLERLAALHEDADAKIALLAQMAALAEGELRAPEQAIGHWRRVLELRPNDRPALAALARLLERQGDWAGLAEVCARQLEGAADLAERQELLARLGEVYQDRLGELDRAQQAWQGLLELDPEHPVALARLQDLFSARQDWAQLAEMLERRVRLEPDPAEAVALLLRRAAILESSLNQPRQAIQALEEARERIPGDPQVLRPLQRLLMAQGEHRRAAGAIEEELAHASPEERVELSFQIAELWRNQIKEPQQAITWYGKVVALVPDHRDSLLALRTLHRRQGDLAALETVIDTLLRITPDLAERHGLLMELGDAAREAGDPLKAFQRYRQAHQLAPERPEAMEGMRRLAEAHGLWERLIEALQWTMVQQTKVEEKRVLLEQVAQVQEQRLGSKKRAAATLRFAFALRPEEGPLLVELERLARETAGWQIVLEALDLLLKNSKRPLEQIAIRHRKARLLVDQLQDVPAAFAELRAAFQLDLAYEPTRLEIERLAEVSGEWRPLLDTYADLLDKVENLRAQILLQQRMASILEQKLNDPQAALAALARAFLLDPLSAQVELDLNRLGEELGEWSLLARTFEAALDHTEEPRVKARFLQRLAEIWEGPLASPPQAFDCYSRAFGLDPRSERSAAELTRLAAVTDGGWEKLHALFSETADRVQAMDVEVALRRRCLRVLEEELHDTARSTAHLLRLWQLDEASEEELRKLSARLREEEAWDRLLHVHQSVLSRTTDPERRLARLSQIAALQERAADPKAAIGTLREILREDPGNIEALRSLTHVQLACGNWEGAIASLEDEAERLADRSAAHALGLQIAGIWERELGRPDKAARRLQRILDEDSDHAAAFAELEALHLREGSWEDLLDLLERTVERARTREQRLAYLERMARIAWERFENRKRAVRCMTRILDEDPGNAAALERMSSFMREERRWGDLLDVLERQVAHNGADSPRTLRLLLEIGEIYERQLFSRKRASEAYERALRLAPRDERVLEPLDRLYTEEEDWPDCMRIRRMRAQLAAGTPLLGTRLLALAEVELLHLEDAERAEATLRSALDADPGLHGELAVWRERFTASKNRKAVQVLLGVEESSAASAEERAALLCERGRIAEADGDRATALLRYRKALEARPGHLPALAALTALHRAAGEWQEVDLYLGRTVRLLGGERGAAAEPPAGGAAGREGEGEGAARASASPAALQPAGLAEHYLDWARVALLLGERGMAIARLEHALELAPGYRPALKVLGELYFDDAHWEAAEVCYRKLLETAATLPTPDREAPTWSYRLGRSLEATGRYGEAVQSYRDTLRLDAEHPEAQAHLLACLERSEAWDEAARAMERQASRTSDPARRYELLVKLGSLLQEKLGRREAALARLEEAHRIDPLEPRALRGLLAILQGGGEPARVIALAGDLAQVARDPQEAHRLHLLRGQLLLEQLHRPEAAAECFRRALESEPLDSEAVAGLVRALATHPEWSEQARILEEHVAALDRAGRPVPARILLELAGLLHEHLGRSEEALALLDRAVAEHATVAEVHRRRAALLESLPGRGAEVVGHLEQALELDFGHVETHHRLLAALLAQGQRGRAFAHAEIMGFLQLLHDDEARLVQELRCRAGARADEPPPQLAALLRTELLADPPLDGPVAKLLDALLELAPGALLDPQDEGQVRSAQKLEPGSQHSLSLRFTELQQTLGLQGRALYVFSGGKRLVEPLATDPPALLVSDALVRGLFRKEQRFYLGRGLVLTARPMFLARTLSAEAGEGLIALLAREDGERDAAAGPEQQLLLRWAPLHASLARKKKQRARLAGLARTAGPGAFTEWQTAVERWAVRVATILAGDLAVALKALHGEIGPDRRRALREIDGLLELQRRSPLARDLLRWLRSERYPALLEKLGRL